MSASASPRMAYTLLTLTALFWAGNFVLARATHATIAPMTLSFSRWAIALCILLPFGLRPAWQQRTLWCPYWRRLLVLGVLGVGSFNSLVYSGLQYTAATNAVILNSFIPILIIVLGALFFKTPIRLLQSIAVALSFVGVVVIVSHGRWQQLITLDINRGDAAVFTAMMAWALYTLLLRAIPANIDRVGLLTILVAIGASSIAPFFAFELYQGHYTALTPSTLLTFAYVGTLPSVAAYYFYNLGVARVGATRAGMFNHLVPAFGTLLSMLVLGETLHTYHVLGIGLILSGVLLSTRTR